MPTGRHIQTSFAAGEFDPLLWSREDVTFFYNSARRVENATPLPQGGAKRREGWRLLYPQRGELDAISLAGATVTAPNGGTAGNAKDGNTATLLTTTTPIGTTDPYVIASVDFGGSVDLSALDIDGLRLIGASVSAPVILQSSPDNATWTTRDTFNVGSNAYTRRFAAPPDQLLGSARYWRIAVSSSVDMGAATAELGEIYAWSEAGYTTGGTEPGENQIFRLTSSISDEYALVLTAGVVDVFRYDTGVWVASLPVPHGDATVRRTKATPNLDTVIFYHQDVQTWLIQRLGSDGDWRSGPVVFDSVTRFAFDDANVSGGVNEKQVLNFSSMAAGNKLVLEYEGETTAEITWNATAATNAAALATAMEGLANVTDVTGAVYDGTGVDADLSIEFVGVDGKKPWPIIIVNILTGSGTVTIDRLQFGKPDTDDLFSATRGWPACGAFYQGRHWMGGFKARPDLLVGSRAGAIFDFKEDADPVAGSPIAVAPNVDDRVEILSLYPGRHLQIFTTSTEFYIPNEPITIDNIALKATSRLGAGEFTQAVDVQGGTLFVDRNGRALREYLFTDAEQSYSAEPVSLLAGHLLAVPRSMALRRGSDVDKPTMLFLANTARDRFGDLVPAAVCVIDRAQQVTAFVRIDTEGTPLSFGASQNGEAVVMVQRQVAGIAWNFLEVFDEDAMSDCSAFITNPDVEEFTATADQTVFTYTFTSPLVAADVAAWSFDGIRWQRLGGYTVDLGAKTVTFDDGRALGEEIRINRRRDTITLGTAGAHLEGVEVYAHGDGLPLGLYTSAAGVIDLGDSRYDFEAEVGLYQVPRIVMHTYKGKGEISPTMANMRIFQALIAMERTGAITIGTESTRQRPIPLRKFGSGETDPTLEEMLFSGVKRIAGVGSWEKEPCLVISQDAPMPWLIRSITYDVRF